MKHKDVGMKVVAHAIMSIMTIIALVPFVLMIVSSLTDEKTLTYYGYAFFPKKLSLDAYKFLFQAQKLTILRGYGITLLVTAVGTIASLIITTMLAYALSRPKFPFGKFLNFLVFFSMLFNGGLVPTYIVYATGLGIRNTIYALLIPGLLMKGMFVLMTRSYFISAIPEAVIESAVIDGADEFRVYRQIVLPLSLPILATVGLFSGLNYWNDWYNGLIFITDSKLFNIQNILNRILLSIQYLKNSTDVEASQLLSDIPTASVRMALATVGVLPIMVVYPFFQKYFVKGIALGAVKG